MKAAAHSRASPRLAATRRRSSPAPRRRGGRGRRARVHPRPQPTRGSTKSPRPAVALASRRRQHPERQIGGPAGGAEAHLDLVPSRRQRDAQPRHARAVAGLVAVAPERAAVDAQPRLAREVEHES